jgi:cell division septal protein FtsQ
MKHRILLAAAAVAAIVLIVALSPLLLQHVGFFRVRQVELVGVSHHSPRELLRAIDIESDRNLFEPLKDIEENAATLPGVIAAKAERRMPGTLTIVVEERVPVAFVPTSNGLLAIDADARPLTYDPIESGLDLPIVQSADSTLARVLATVWAADSGLYQHVEAARVDGDNVVILELGATEIILRREPSFDEVKAVGLVRRHLTATGRPYDELDVRFEGRVIVRGSGV